MLRMWKLLSLSSLGFMAACATTKPPPPPPVAPVTEIAMIKPDCVDAPFQIYFKSDEKTLDAYAKGVVGQIIEKARACKPTAIEIVGHADAVGSEEVNKRVSQARAEAVLKAIQDANLNVERIAIVAAGKQNAITEDNKIVANNRKVELRLID